jgi:Domain of unknown function (DUF397)
MEELIQPRWRKSSHSGNGGGDCVEVARATCPALCSCATPKTRPGHN